MTHRSVCAALCSARIAICASPTGRLRSRRKQCLGFPWDEPNLCGNGRTKRPLSMKYRKPWSVASYGGLTPRQMHCCLTPALNPYFALIKLTGEFHQSASVPAPGMSGCWGRSRYTCEPYGTRLPPLVFRPTRRTCPTSRRPFRVSTCGRCRLLALGKTG